MADRGRLFYDSNGELWEVDPNASISGEPDPADLQPVRMGEMGAKVVELDQQADDGTDRVFIRGSDGAIKSEIYFDGTNTVINPLTGLVDVQGALTTGAIGIGDGDTIEQIEFGTESKDGDGDNWTAAPAPTSDGWDDTVLKRKSVTFSTEFETAPRVFLTGSTAITSRGTLSASVITTTGFNLDFNHQSTTTFDSERNINWLAVGP